MTGKILSPHQLKTLKGIHFSRAHMWRLTKAGKFPAPIKVGDRTNGYLEAEVDAWIAARVAARDEYPPADLSTNRKPKPAKLSKAQMRADSERAVEEFLKAGGSVKR